MSVSDLFVFPSNKEGMPVSIMEATAMGVPVITFNSRGCNDIIRDNFNGKLLDVNSDHIAIAETIVDLYSNKKKLEKMSSNALAKRNDFDRNLFIEESEEIFKHYTKTPFLNNVYSLSNGRTINSPGDAGI